MAPTGSKDGKSGDEDDLSALLDDLDVSGDFLASLGESNGDDNSFSTTDSKQGGGEDGKGIGLEVSLSGEPMEDSLVDEDEQQDLVWKQRLEREEIFSHRYRPSRDEQKELDLLETDLGIKKPSSRRGFLFRAISGSSGTEGNGNSSEMVVWNELVHPTASKKTPSSILLKRGPCLWREGDLTDLDGSDDGCKSNGDESRNKVDEVECEVILLTHGLVVATVLSGKKSNQKQFSRAILLSHVQSVQPALGGNEPYSWQIVLQQPDSSGDSSEVWTFACTSKTQQRNWLQALEKVVINWHEHAGRQTDLGWQYRHIHKPGFTMAVTDRVDNFPLAADVLSELDSYQGFAPLHYAVRCQNEQAVQKLIEAGADPNQPDREEERTPMDHALRDHAPRAIVELLTAGGAKYTERGDDRGALFGQVEAVQEKRHSEKLERERHELEERKKAETAQLQMQENMRLLQQRGEKIDELGNKATELNQGAKDFSTMAKMLKEKNKQQSKWLPF